MQDKMHVMMKFLLTTPLRIKDPMEDLFWSRNSFDILYFMILLFKKTFKNVNKVFILNFTAC